MLVGLGLGLDGLTDSHIFNTGIPIPGKDGLYIEMEHRELTLYQDVILPV